jgi:hypothetical protein
MAYIIRRNGAGQTFPTLASLNLFPYLANSHLVLAEYLGLHLPARLFVSAEDRNRGRWVEDPAGYDAGRYVPNLGVGGDNRRHPYGATFRIGACFIDGNPPGLRVAPTSSSTGTVLIPGGSHFFGQPLTSILYPSQKVIAFDQFARHFGPRVMFSTFSEARQPLLSADGSASIRSAADANPGADPNNTASNPPEVFMQYVPTAIDPPPIPGLSIAPGRFMWTRRGLLGRDFGGPVVP